MSVPFSELTKKLKTDPDDEIKLCYGFLGDFRRLPLASADSKIIQADFLNFTPDFGPDKKEVALGEIQAQKLGKGGYPAVLVIVHETKKKKFRTLAVINAETTNFETNPYPRVKTGCAQGCLIGLGAFAVLGIPGGYMLQNHESAIEGLVLIVIAALMLLYSPLAGRTVDQEQYREEVRTVCRALTKDRALYNRYITYQQQFEQNGAQNNQVQGFVDIDLDS